jgi:stearoyl-CoA desaturase (delta-9 desaturase)
MESAVLTAPPPSARRARRRGRPRIDTIAWFAGIHVACLLAFVVGVSTSAIVVAVALYAVRMFAITAGYHRHFSHRSYDTSRAFRFAIGLVATLAIQKGPLWWASVHRHHHRTSDTEDDAHSPRWDGFWWSHIGWIVSTRFVETDLRSVRDFARYPEIRWLDRWYLLPPAVFSAFVYAAGEWWGATHPASGATGLQWLVWGMAISTVACYHASWCVNSLLHVWGGRRFRTNDDSRNNFLVALYTFGEGWHNNHHRFAASERQGFYWWQVDFGHWILSALSWVGLVWDLKRPTPAVLEEGRGG